MNAATLHPRTVGELLSTAFEVARARYADLVFAALVLAAPGLLLDLLLPEKARFLAMGLLTFLLNFVTAAAVVIVSNVYLGRMSDPNEVYRRVFSRFWTILAAALLQTVAIGIGWVLCVVPGVYLTIALALMPVIVMLEGADAGTAFERSRALVEGHWWRVAAGMVVSAIAVSGAQWAVSLTLHLTGVATPWVIEAARVLLMVLCAPLPVVILTLFYFDLRVRKEGFDTQTLSEAMGPAPTRETPAAAW